MTSFKFINNSLVAGFFLLVMTISLACGGGGAVKGDLSNLIDEVAPTSDLAQVSGAAAKAELQDNQFNLMGYVVVGVDGLGKVGSGRLQIADRLSKESARISVSQARVLIRDLDGKTLAEGKTDAKGYFDIVMDAVGVVELVVNRRMNNVDYSFQTYVSTQAKVRMMLGKKYIYDRRQAISLVRDIVGKDPLVVGSLQPLPRGTRVVPALGDISAKPISKDREYVVNTESQWFFMVDHNHEAAYAHEVVYAFVDTETGEVILRDKNYWWPRINGKPHWYPGDQGYRYDDMLMSDAKMRNSDDLEYQIKMTPEIVNLPSRALDLTRSLLKPRFDSVKRNKGDSEEKECPVENFGFIVCLSPEPWMRHSAMQMLAWMKQNGVPEANIAGAVPNSVAPLTPKEKLTGPYNYYLYINSQYNALEKRIAASKENGKKPSLFVAIIGHGTDTGEVLVIPNPRTYLVMPQRFYTRKVTSVVPAHETSACQVNIFIAVCYAYSHMKAYEAKFNERVVEKPEVHILTASANGEARGNSSGIGEYTGVYSDVSDDDASLRDSKGKIIRLGYKFTRDILRKGKIKNGNFVSGDMPFIDIENEADREDFDEYKLKGSNVALHSYLPGDACVCEEDAGEIDSDVDGVSDEEERATGTNPRDPDSDHDGLTDGKEKEHGSNPLHGDSDTDGVTDGDEIKRGTDPTDSDTDGDGITDDLDEENNVSEVDDGSEGAELIEEESAVDGEGEEAKSDTVIIGQTNLVQIIGGGAKTEIGENIGTIEVPAEETNFTLINGQGETSNNGGSSGLVEVPIEETNFGYILEQLRF